MTHVPIAYTSRQAVLVFLKQFGWFVVFRIAFWILEGLFSAGSRVLSGHWSLSGLENAKGMDYACTLISWFMTVHFELRRFGVSWRQIGRWGWQPRASLLPALLVASGVTILGNEMINLIHWLHPAWGVVVVQGEPINTMLFGLYGVFGASVVEEYPFRGLILQGLLVRVRPWAALLLSSALFGLAHWNIAQGCFAFIIGLGLGSVYMRTRSLGLCMLMHGAINLMAHFGGWLLPQFILRGLVLSTPHGPQLFQPWWLDATGAAFCLLGLWGCRWLSAQAEG